MHSTRAGRADGHIELTYVRLEPLVIEERFRRLSLKLDYLGAEDDLDFGAAIGPIQACEPALSRCSHVELIVFELQ